MYVPYQRIIEPLASRCSKFRFKALDPSSTRARVEMIANAESVQLDDRVRPYTCYAPLFVLNICIIRLCH